MLGNGGRFTTGKSIRKRDKSVYKRNEFGHWEADTVVSGRDNKSMFCYVSRKKNKILHSNKDTRYKYGESNNLNIIKIAERRSKNNNMW